MKTLHFSFGVVICVCWLKFIFEYFSLKSLEIMETLKLGMNNQVSYTGSGEQLRLR
jgi:hypothetical protein